MSVHVKKCHPGPFAAVVNGTKPFEYRREDDCKFAVDDLLLLLEWHPGDELVWSGSGQRYRRPEAGYTGETCKRRITYVLRAEFGVPDGYVVLGLAPVPEPVQENCNDWPSASKGLR